MTRDDVRDWVERYRRAWASNDPADIGDLFTEDATYSTGPWDLPWTGRDAIVAGWLEERDDPGTWSFQYDVVAVDGDLGVVEGETVYGPPLEEMYRNLWLIRFDGAGRATSFAEWWIQKP